MIREFFVGQKVNDHFLITDIQIRTASSGKPYLTGKLSDNSGTVDFQFWNYFGYISSANNGEIVKVEGEVREYREAKQLTVFDIDIVSDYSGLDLSKIVKKAPIDAEKAVRYIEEIIKTIKDEDYRKVTDKIFDKHKETMKKIPAAKSVHHGFVNGLIMHTSYMVMTADSLSKIYKDVIDRDLLIAGTILHDFAKEYEFGFSTLGTVSDYSMKGQLLGHIIMGANEVSEVCRELGVPEEKSVLLQHMILSHHGEPEFGAAVKPMTAEAELLSYIDMIDSRMEIYKEASEDIEKGEFSKRLFALDKKIYKH